jgi:hypothetical protein
VCNYVGNDSCVVAFVDNASVSLGALPLQDIKYSLPCYDLILTTPNPRPKVQIRA